MTDPYATLGVQRSADAPTIKRAYRKLAKKWHPDRNPDNPDAADRFKAVQSAHDVLSDAEKRRLFDQFGAASLEPGFDPSLRHAKQPRGGVHAEGFSVDDLLSQLFGAQPGMGWAGGRAVPIHARVHLDFRTAVQGGQTELAFGDGAKRTIRIPPGVRPGETLTLRGAGPDHQDLLLTLEVSPHPAFRRNGEDLLVELPITVGEAIGGASVRVPTVDGAVMVTIPPGTQAGARLRVRGKGVARHGRPPGDLIAEIAIHVPRSADPATLAAALAAIDASYGGDVREGLLRAAAA